MIESNHTEHSYADFLAMRRKIESARGYSPVVDCIKKGSTYRLEMIHKNIRRFCVVEGSDITDFETNRKQFCNKVLIPNTIPITSHDFSSTTNWISPSNSLFVIQPKQGEKYKLKHVFIKLDKDTQNISDSNKLTFVLWRSYGDSNLCPSFVTDTVTDYGSPLYDSPNTVTGWEKLYGDNVQVIEDWLHYTNDVPDYRATVYQFNSVNSITKNTIGETIGNLLDREYDARTLDANSIFRDSLNERVEVFLSNDVKLNLVDTDLYAVCIFNFDIMDEW